jgi:DNA topoisomerase IB
MGTLLTATGCGVDRPESDRDAKRVITQTIEGVAAQLGNTAAVCRQVLRAPDVIELFLAATSAISGRSSGEGVAGPARDEHRLLELLRPRRSRRAAA